MAKAVAGSLGGLGVTFGTEASINLAAFQQPVLPAGPATYTCLSPWPNFPDFTRQGGTAVTPQVTISGGSGVTTVIGNVSVGSTGTFPLGAGNGGTVSISYTTAPTVTFSLGPWFQPDPRNAKTAVNV